MPVIPKLVGEAMSPIRGDDVVLVEGTMGNPVPVHHDTVKKNEVFYLLFTAMEGRTAADVARTLKDNYDLKIRDWVDPSAPANPHAPVFDLYVDPDQSYHYLHEKVRDDLRTRPSLKHLKFKFGEKADYYMIACRFGLNVSEPEDKKKYDQIFGKERRIIHDEGGGVADDSINTFKFDILQMQRRDSLLLTSAAEMGQNASVSRMPEVLHRGGLFVYDRHDPNGNPDNFYIAWASDPHVARVHDKIEAEIIKRQDGKLYLKYNNPNENLWAIIQKWKEMYAKGLLDMVIITGDNKDHNGINNEAADDLLESNTLLLASFLDQVPVPVFTIDGNHDDIQEEPPGSVMARNYQLDSDEVEDIQSDRYGGLFGWWNTMLDSIDSMVIDPRGTLPDRDIINRFQDVKLILKGDDTMDSPLKTVRLGLVDTGSNDLYHPWPDDKFYKKFPQGLWPWPPWFHPRSIWELIWHRSPDQDGLDEEQRAWVGDEDFHYLFGHAPSLNGKDEHVYQPGSKVQITPLKLAGPYEDNSVGGMAESHSGEDFIQGQAIKREFRAYFSGHQHRLGNEYVVARNKDGDIEYFTGPLMAVLESIDPKDQKSLACFWEPTEEKLKDPEINPTLKVLYSSIISTHHDFKLFFQLGSSAVEESPHFAHLTLTPEGHMRQKLYYPAKKFASISKDHADPGDPKGQRYVVRYEFQSTPPGSTQKVHDEWLRMSEESKPNPKAQPTIWLDMEPSQIRLNNRAELNTSFVPNSDSLKPYPKVEQLVGDPVTAATRLKTWLRAYYFGNQTPTSDGIEGEEYGVGLDVSFSQYLMDPKVRSYLLQGASVGYRRTSEGRHLAHVAYNFPDYFDQPIGEHFVLRGLNPRLGFAMENDTPAFHRSMKVLEGNLHFENWEFSLGWYYDWTRTNRSLYMAGFGVGY